jgi:uroporphyrinogen-III synthase
MKIESENTKPLFLLARSKPGSDSLAALLHFRGLALRCIALVDSVVVEKQDQLAELLLQARSADWLMFVSPNAVHASVQLVPDLNTWLGTPCAVGKATAQALASVFVDRLVLAPKQGEGALALLNAAQLQNLAQQKVAIFTAPNGLPELRDHARARGAQVLELTVYQRRVRTLSEAERRLCRNAQFAYVGSGAFLEALMAARDFSPLTLFVPSQRVATLAERYGCSVQICENSTEAALISQIQQMQW